MIAESLASGRRTKRAQGSAKIQAAFLALGAVLLVVPFGHLGDAAARTVAGRTVSSALLQTPALTSTTEAGLAHGAAALAKRLAEVADGQLARAFPSRLVDYGDEAFDLTRATDQTIARELIENAKARLMKPRTDDLELVNAYAREYVYLQQNHNGAVPDQTLVRNRQFSGIRSGDLPYWDVDPKFEDLDIHLAGLADAGAFVEGDKVRIFVHYADKNRITELTNRLGVGPTGTVPAEMTSSYRTLMVYPEGKRPYMLKLPGEFRSSDKGLPPVKVDLSVERSIRLQGRAYVTPEYAGFAATYGNRHFTGIERALPLPSRTLKDGDVLVPAHVIQDPEFWKTDLGKQIQGNYASPEDWYKAEVVPVLGDAVYDSSFDAATYLEFHSQNTDFFINADGHVEEVFLKDLLDMVHDPAMEAANGVAPFGTQHVRDVVWKNIGEANGKYTPLKFHRDYLGQVGLPGYRGYGAGESARYTVFHEWLRDHIKAKFLSDAPRAQLEPYGTLQAIEASSQPLYETIQAIREDLVMSGVNRRFVADAAAESIWNEADRIGNRPVQRAVESGLSSYEYGFIGDAPVRVRRDADGLVRDYEFRFK